MGLFNADLLPVTGKLARTEQASWTFILRFAALFNRIIVDHTLGLLLAKGLSLNVAPNARAEGTTRKITEQTILSLLCGSNNTDEYVHDIISSCVGTRSL